MAELSVERARRDTETRVPGGKPTFGNFGQKWGTRKPRQQIKKRGEMNPPADNRFGFRSHIDYGFFTGFLGARFVAAGFLT